MSTPLVDTVYMADPHDTRALIVQAGTELVDTAGLASVGLRSIARHAGVSHGAPRRYFPTHRSLLSAIAAVGLNDLKTAMAESDSEPSSSPNTTLSAMARAYVDFAARRPGMFELLFRHDLLEGGGENLRDTTVPMLTTVERLVATVLGRDQASSRALLLWASIHGIAMLTATRALDVFETDLEALVTDAVFVHLHAAAEQ